MPWIELRSAPTPLHARDHLLTYPTPLFRSKMARGSARPVGRGPFRHRPEELTPALSTSSREDLICGSAWRCSWPGLDVVRLCTSSCFDLHPKRIPRAAHETPAYLPVSAVALTTGGTVEMAGSAGVADSRSPMPCMIARACWRRRRRRQSMRCRTTCGIGSHQRLLVRPLPQPCGFESYWISFRRRGGTSQYHNVRAAAGQSALTGAA